MDQTREAPDIARRNRAVAFRCNCAAIPLVLLGTVPCLITFTGDYFAPLSLGISLLTFALVLSGIAFRRGRWIARTVSVLIWIACALPLMDALPRWVLSLPK